MTKLSAARWRRTFASRRRLMDIPLCKRAKISIGWPRKCRSSAFAKFAFSSSTAARWLRCDRMPTWPALFFALCFLTEFSAGAATDAIFDQVVRQAQMKAAAPYRPNEMPLPDVLAKLNYDTYRLITFRPDRSLWRDHRLLFEVQFFHPGYLFRQPVAVNEVDAEQVRAVPFSPKFFRYAKLDPAQLAGSSALHFAGL